KYPNRAGQTGTKSLTIPRDATGGAKEGATREKTIQRMRTRMQAELATSEQMRRLMRQVRLINTTEGIRIDLVDDADFSMFQLGTTVLTPQAVKLLGALAEAVAPEKGGLSVRGHTDALQWRTGGLGNNWALSAGRAEATRQALIRENVDQGRFRRIEGVADRELLIQGNPSDPRNRRI